MRRIISYINSTFNGIVTGDPGNDKTNFMVWTTKAFITAGSECLVNTMKSVDTILLGRNTYEDLSRPSKWPSVKEWAGGDKVALELGEKINSANKLVVSRHPIHGLEWGDFKAPQALIGDDVVEQIRSIKSKKGGDVIIFGSPTLVRNLTDSHLIDEYQIQVRPIVVNVGEPLFMGLKEKLELRLVEVTPLVDGTLFVKYQPSVGS